MNAAPSLSPTIAARVFILISTTKNSANNLFTILVLFLIMHNLRPILLRARTPRVLCRTSFATLGKTLGRVLASRFPKSVQMLRIFTEIWHSVVLSSQNTFASTTSTYVRARGARPYGRLRLYYTGSQYSPLRTAERDISPVPPPFKYQKIGGLHRGWYRLK